jgi:hypothetical protein
LNPVDPQLESTWFQPLSKSSDKLVSSLCFQIQPVPLQLGLLAAGGVFERAGRGAGLDPWEALWAGVALPVVGLYKLNLVVTHSLKPPGFNP